MDAARALGWLVYHTFDSRHSEFGWPDLAMLHPAHGAVFAELKAAGKKLTAAQEMWCEALERLAEGLIPASVHAPMRLQVFRWWPDDWTSGRIESVLRGGT